MLVRKKKRKKREGEKKKKRNTGQSCTKYQLDKRDEIGMRMRWIRKKKKGATIRGFRIKILGGKAGTEFQLSRFQTERNHEILVGE